MRKAPLVSVVMPVYNRQAYVADAIASILSQTYTDFEFIIVDDGSKDRSVEIINEFSLTDSRIRFVQNNQNFGLAITRNKGITLAKGKYIAFMDSDDISLPTRIEKQVDFLENNPDIYVIGTSYALINGNGEILKTQQVNLTPIEIRWLLISKSAVINPSTMSRRELFTVHGYQHAEMVAASDFDLWNRVSEKFKIAILPDILIYFRSHKQRISNTSQDNQRANAIKITRRSVRNITGRNLSDAQVIGLNNPYRIKTTQDAIIISKTIINLQKGAIEWGSKKDDQIRVKKLAANGLRSVWRNTNRSILLLPFFLYSLWLDPQYLRYFNPKKR